MTQESNIRTAQANAFLYRCAGMPDLALGYLKDSFRFAGQPGAASPPRGVSDRFLAWLERAMTEGLESAAHDALREACLATPIDPPPFQTVEDLQPTMAEDDLARAADYASRRALEHHYKGDPAAAFAGYQHSLLLNPHDTRANFNLGVVYINREAWDPATLHLEAVLRVEPTAQDALMGLHNIALKANRMVQLAPHLEGLLRAKEAPAPARTDAQPAAPVIALSVGAAAVSELVLGRGAARVISAARSEICAALRTEAAEWFAANRQWTSWPVMNDAPDLCDPDRLLTPGLIAALHRILGHAPTLSRSDTYVRVVSPHVPESRVPFHQDVAAFADTGVNVWTPLVDCGVDAPTLEVMARRTTKVFPTIGTNDAYNQTEIPPEVVYADFAPEWRFYPILEVGDALLFLGSTVHRSHIAPGMTRERISLEMRFY